MVCLNHKWTYHTVYDEYLRRDIFVYCECMRCGLKRATSLDGDKKYEVIDNINVYFRNLESFKNSVLGW